MLLRPGNKFACAETTKTVTTELKPVDLLSVTYAPKLLIQLIFNVNLRFIHVK